MPNRPPKPRPASRDHFAQFVPITTRWMDNDVYGHVNNVVYYSFFDTAVNQFLIAQGAMDIHQGAVIGLVVHSACDFFSPLAFPGTVDAGLRVARVGESSVEYEIGLFSPGAELSAAGGRFVHVYVARETRRPQALPSELRSALMALTTSKSNHPSTDQP